MGRNLPPMSARKVSMTLESKAFIQSIADRRKLSFSKAFEVILDAWNDNEIEVVKPPLIPLYERERIHVYAPRAKMEPFFLKCKGNHLTSPVAIHSTVRWIQQSRRRKRQRR